MKIAISGAHGLVGTRLTNHFTAQGHQVIGLRRNMYAPEACRALASLLGECDVVINLAGASLDHPWTKEYKKQIYESRVHTTRALVAAINSLSRKPLLFISASAVGYYPVVGCYTEENARNGNGFLAEVCRAWEAETTFLPPEVRRVVTRFATIFSPDGGAFPKMALPARWGFPVRFSPSLQPFPWIDLDDLVRIFDLIIARPDIEGAVNCVAPLPLTNRGLAAALGRRYKDILTIPVPKCLLKLALGDMAQLLTNAPCVHPGKLQQLDFPFLSSGIDDFLKKV